MEEKIHFHDMGLDDRLLKAISKLGWAEPTPVQEKAIPLALDGKDVLLRARTGSGKTATYSIPIIQQLLSMKRALDVGSKKLTQETRAIILVPSRELSRQAFIMMQQLTAYSSRDITFADVSTETDLHLIKPVLAARPDIVIGTPSRVLAHVIGGSLNVTDSLRWLVLDEADLLFSFGYEVDTKSLLSRISTSYQAFLMSATLSEDTDSLKKLVLRNPVTLNLDEEQLPNTETLSQYHVLCDCEDDKYLLIYALIKLKLIRGKSLLFVNTIARAYRLKLFLEQFSIFCCVLNSELPVNTRCHVVEQFSQGLYDYIIATDESAIVSATSPPKQDAKVEKKPGKSRKKRMAKMKDYGVSRGIDFQNVSNVINFDFPPTVDSYIHRVGRTARGDQMGSALSFVASEEVELLNEAQKRLSSGSEDTALKPYQFKMDEIEGFRYRCKDAIRAVTKDAVRDARIKEVRREMLNSSKLNTYFEENPNDLRILRHDTVLRPVKVKRHMKNVPEYLIPATLKNMYTGGQSSAKRSRVDTSGRGKRGPTMGKPNPKYRKRRQDPLKSFKLVKK